ncbi:hypothetical protein [Sinobaca sp. H24]|uniref:hypothetical protein n=1 Tax=Sinobaca sp. H24 TaxID=2923376 RepID=UPI00207962EF|nr:hypothetical protein [Sinobaca sp. H24]
MLEYIVRNQKMAERRTHVILRLFRNVCPGYPGAACSRRADARTTYSLPSGVCSIGNTHQLVPFMVKKNFPARLICSRPMKTILFPIPAVSYPPKRISLTSYYIWNDRLYKIDPEADRDIVLLFHMLMDTPQGRLPLSSEEVGQVYKQIVAPLEQNEKLEMTESIRASIEEQPLSGQNLPR